MKVLIWVGCFFVATILNTILGYATGVKVGYLIFYFVVYFVAKKLCNIWDEHKSAKEEDAEKVADAIEANLQNQPNFENDIDFGLVAKKPVYLCAELSHSDKNKYLNNLYTDNGEKITWQERGFLDVYCVNGKVEVYDTFLPSGKLYKKIYINMYGATSSTKTPVGFILKDKMGVQALLPEVNHNLNEATLNKPIENLSQHEKISFCRKCGEKLIENSQFCRKCGTEVIKE